MPPNQERSDRRLTWPKLAGVGLVLVAVAALAAFLPYWPCSRCEGSGQLHDFDGARITPSAYAHLRPHVKPRTYSVVACEVCNGRARCAGYCNVLDLWR
jgi:hypothetical protein